MVATFVARGGPIVTIGAALLFLWVALTGWKPGESVAGEPARSKQIGAPERLMWASLGIALLIYEYVKVMSWVHAQQALH